MLRGVRARSDPKSLVATCIDLLRPKGHLFLSTINKNPRSWITAIVGAEYIFNILPKGTHEFDNLSSHQIWQNMLGMQMQILLRQKVCSIIQLPIKLI